MTRRYGSNRRPPAGRGGASFAPRYKAGATNKDHRGDEIAGGRVSNVTELPKEDAGLQSRIELYEFQLRNLRRELEQIKMQSIIENLGGESATWLTSDCPEPDFDDDLFDRVLDFSDLDGNASYNEICEYAAHGYEEVDAPEPALLPATTRRNSFPGMTPDATAAVFKLSAMLSEAETRNRVQEILIHHLSEKLKHTLSDPRPALACHLHDRLEPATVPAEAAPPENKHNAVPDEFDDMRLLEQNNQPVYLFELAHAAEIIMEMEQRTADMREVIEHSEEVCTRLMEENGALAASNSDLRDQLADFHKHIDRHFSEQLELMRQHMEAEFAKKRENLEMEFEKLLDMERDWRLEIQNRADLASEEAIRLKTELDEQNKQVEKLLDENAYFRVLVHELKRGADNRTGAPQRETGAIRPEEVHVEEIEKLIEVQPVPLDVFKKQLEEVLDAAKDNINLETLLRLRKTIIHSRRADDGINALLRLLETDGNHALLPSVCVLIGELYMTTGRMEEAEYYLSHPLAGNDATAQALMKNIPMDRLEKRSRQ